LSDYKVIVITHPELAPGFRLTGVAVEEAENVSEAEELIENVLRMGEEYGLIFMDENLVMNINPRLNTKLEDKGVPLLIPFPAQEIYSWLKKKEDEEDYASYLIRNAIGYKIKLK